jgi:predicted nucleic acid-binding protein
VIAVDTNVLVYAHRAELPRHRTALLWLRRLSEDSAPWGLRVFRILLSSPSVRVLNPGSRYPALFQSALRAADARGNLAFDAQIAAVCQEHGVASLLTLDRDFSRFPAIRLVSPAESP